MHGKCCNCTCTPDQTGDDLGRARRLASFIAHHDRSTFEIAKAFVDQFSQVFPPVKGMLPMATKTARYQTACAIAAVCKHASDLDAIAPMIAATGADLAKRGFRAFHVLAARKAFMNAVRSCANGDWTLEIERDWNGVIDGFVDHLGLAADTACQPIRRAA